MLEQVRIRDHLIEMLRAFAISVLLAQPLASAWLDASWRPRRCALRAEADGSSWRPDVVDPLGKVWGAPAKKSRPYGYWLDLRAAENTFAQMVVVKLFYAVRRVTDEAGVSLPGGSRVEGLLYDADRFDRADTMGQEAIPVFLETGAGEFVNATLGSASAVPLPQVALRAPTTLAELSAARDELQAASGAGRDPAAIALPDDPMLWAVALTERDASELEAKEGNAGA